MEMRSGRMHGAGWARACRTGLLVASVLVAATAVLVGPASAAQAGPVRGPMVGVIVRYDPAAGPAFAQRTVQRSGGAPGQHLGIIDGFAAVVPAGAVAAVRAATGVESVTVNAPVRMTGQTWLADKDENSLYSITKAAGVHDAWSRSDASGRKITGTGVVA